MSDEPGYLGPSPWTETARSQRYRLQVLDQMTPVLLFLNRCTRPAPDIDVIAVHNGPTQVPRPGKYRWKPVEFTFYETVSDPFSTSGAFGTDTTAEMIYRWWAQNTYDIQTSTLGRSSSVAPGSPASYRTGTGTSGGYAPPASLAGGIYKPAQLTLLDGAGNRIWDYYLIDCWPSTVHPSDMNYKESNISEITVTLQYSACVEIVNSSATGSPQPGTPGYYNQNSTVPGRRFDPTQPPHA